MQWVRFWNPRAEPRRCSRRPLIASVGPLEVWGWSKQARMSPARRLSVLPSVSRQMPWHPQRRHHRSAPVIRHANTAWSVSMRWPVTSRPRSYRRVNALRLGRSKVVLDMSKSFGWTVQQSPSSEDLDPYPATTRPTPPTTPTPSNAKSPETACML